MINSWGLFHLHLHLLSSPASLLIIQLEPAATDQSEDPSTTEQSEVHLEPAGTEQLDLQIEPATTELQFQLEPATTAQPPTQMEIQTHDVAWKEGYS